MKNMFNVTTVLPHNFLQTNPWIRHNFSTQVFRKRGTTSQCGPWAVLHFLATFGRNTFSFKNPHKKKSYGIISGLRGGHRCTDTGGTRPLHLQHRTISFKFLVMSVNCLSARSPPCTKVCTKTSLSRYYTLCFCIKQYNFHILIYSQLPVVRHCSNWWHLSHYPWTTAFTRTFANIDTMMLQF